MRMNKNCNEKQGDPMDDSEDQAQSSSPNDDLKNEIPQQPSNKEMSKEVQREVPKEEPKEMPKEVPEETKEEEQVNDIHVYLSNLYHLIEKMDSKKLDRFLKNNVNVFKELDSLEQERKRLTEKITTLEGEKKGMDEEKKKKEQELRTSHRKQLEDLEKEKKNEKKRENDKYSALVDEKKKIEDELKYERTEVRKLQNELKVATEKIESLKDKLCTIQSHAEKHKQADDILKEVKKLATNTNGNVTRLENEKKDKDKEIGELKSESWRLQGDITRLRQDLDNAKKERQQKSTNFDKEIDNLKKNHTVAIGEKETIIVQLQHEIQKLQGKSWSTTSGSEMTGKIVSDNFIEFVSNVLPQIMDIIEQIPNLNEEQYFGCYSIVNYVFIFNVWKFICEEVYVYKNEKEKIIEKMKEEYNARRVYRRLQRELCDKLQGKSIYGLSYSDVPEEVCKKAVKLCLDIQQCEQELHFIIAKPNEQFDENRFRSLDKAKNRVTVMTTPGIAIMNNSDKSEIIFAKAVVRSK